MTTQRHLQQQQQQQQQQLQQQQSMNYGYNHIGQYEPSDRTTSQSRHRQTQGGVVAIIILLIIVGLLALGSLIAASIAATEAKNCKHHHHAHPRVRVEWDLASEGSCDDMNPCTVDFADHADDPRKTVCMNHPRPNGYPCNSTCFFPERREGATHECKNLGKGCAECRGTRCKGECRRDRDCPTRRGRGPLLRIPQRASCNDGICVWEFFEERSRFNFPCDVDVLRKRCKRFVKPQFRECMDAEPTCGVQFGGRGGKKGGQRDELPMLPMPEETQRGGGGGNGDAGPQLTRCSFSFKCARPSEPYIPKMSGHGGDHPVTKEQEGETTTTEASSFDSFSQDTTSLKKVFDETTLADFKKLTKKLSGSHRRTPLSKSSRHQRQTIEGAAPKRM